MAVKKTATGYQIWYYDAEGKFRKQIAKGVTRKRAEQIEREIRYKVDHGEEIIDRRRAPTFREFSSQWMKEGRARWKPSTIAQYQHVLAKHLTPAFGDRRLNAIREESIGEHLTAWRDSGLSARRINLMLGVLKTILKTATRRRLVATDPATSVRFLPEPRAEIDPLSPAEIKAFIAACPKHWRPYFTFAFWTGARPNEMAALKWGDIDLKQGTARIRAGRARGVEGTPKTPSSVRDVDLSPALVDALKVLRREEWRKRLGSGEGSPEPGKDYVFRGTQRGLLNVNYLRDTIWYPTLSKAELRRRTLYQTRHTFASNALAAGEAPTWIAQMLGHKTPEMLFEVYARHIPNRTRRDGTAFAAEMAAAATSDTPNLLPLESQPVDKSRRAAQIGKLGAEGGT